MNAKTQIAFKSNGRAIYRDRMVNNEWPKVWHHCTRSEAKRMLANGAELHPKSHENTR